ncbi:MAG TPA: hypothetical protein VN253_07785 [Kofleriaceae bacterium]|nr:hypothetical protein [Kofleriaceae bacterium]
MLAAAHTEATRQLLDRARPLIERFARDVVALLVQHVGAAQSRALEVATNQLRAELEVHDVEDHDQHRGAPGGGRGGRRVPRARARQAVPAVARVGAEPSVAGEGDRDARGSAGAAPASRSGAGPHRHAQRCRVCGAAGHNARTCPDRDHETPPARATTAASTGDGTPPPRSRADRFALIEAAAAARRGGALRA